MLKLLSIFGLLLSVEYVICSAFYRTLLFGDQFKGFLNIDPVNDNEFVVTFDVSESEGGVLWSLHTASAPHDMADMEENCKRVKKSPHLMREIPIDNITTVSRDMLMGNTIVVGKRFEVYTCATIILPGQPLMAISIHQEPIEGHIHFIPMEDQIRLLPDIKYLDSYEEYEPTPYILTWAFVPSCDPQQQEKLTDGSELGVSARTTIAYYIKNYTLQSFAIYRSGELFYCAPIVAKEPRVLMGVDSGFSQANCYETVEAVNEIAPSKLRIRDDCLDIATESEHEKYENYYPTVSIFGRDSIMLKSMSDGLCSVLRPQFPKAAATAYFMHPVNGRISIVDTDDKVYLTGELRNVMESSSTRATVQISNEFAGSYGCPENVECTGCPEVQDAALIVGRDDDTVTLSGTFIWFNITRAKSVIVDLMTEKVCANLTYLPNGAITATALFRHITPTETETVASIVTMEYPANNYTEVLINKHAQFEKAVAHSRPVEPSMTVGHPCEDKVLGPVKPVFWAPHLTYYVSSENNDSSALIWFNMITGRHSVLGTSVVLNQGRELFCGHFEPRSKKTVAFASFHGPLSGFIRLTQYAPDNWSSGLPTEVYYSVRKTMRGNALLGNRDRFEWDIVNCTNASCTDAVQYNPFNVEFATCSPERSYLCPLGNATAKSSYIVPNARWHMVIKDLPLVGPYSVIGKYIRIKTSGNSSFYGYSPIRQFTEASVRWIVYRNTSLAMVQTMFASKANLNVYQIGVDYTRELHQQRCSIVRITVSAEEEKLANILDSFDVASYKFTSDQPLRECRCDGGRKLIGMFWQMDNGELDCKRTAGHLSPPMGPRGAKWPPPTHNSLLGTVLLFISFLRSSAQQVSTCTTGEIYLNVTTTKEYVETPNYGKGEYPASMDCHFLLMAPFDHKIMVILEDVQFESQLFDECLDFVSVSKDNLQLKADTIAKVCGKVENRQISSTDNQLKISFFSDQLVQDKGARISYQAIPPNECEPGWYNRRESCIRLVQDYDGADFMEAQVQCSQQQANLVSITNDVDYNLTMLFLSNATGEPWIGYTDSGIEGTIRGITEQGSRLWPIPQPPINGNDELKDCVYLDLAGTHWQLGELPYRIDECRTKQSFICEKSLDGTTIPVPPPVEKIKNGMRKASFDLANLLFFLILLLLLIIGCCICYTTCIRRHNRVQPITQQATHADGVPSATTQPIVVTQTQPVGPATVQDRSISPTVPAPIVSPAIPKTTPVRPTNNNVRMPTPPPSTDPVPVIIGAVELPTDADRKIPTPPPAKAPVTVVNDVETETAILPVREASDAAPSAKPRSLPPLQMSSMSPYQTMNTREDSFMRARIAQELFERPKMELLDNVSAISLDEFWSNTKKKH